MYWLSLNVSLMPGLKFTLLTLVNRLFKYCKRLVIVGGMSDGCLLLLSCLALSHGLEWQIFLHPAGYWSLYGTSCRTHPWDFRKGELLPWRWKIPGHSKILAQWGWPFTTLLSFFTYLILFLSGTSRFEDCNRGSCWGFVLLRGPISVISCKVVYHDLGEF